MWRGFTAASYAQISPTAETLVIPLSPGNTEYRVPLHNPFPSGCDLHCPKSNYVVFVVSSVERVSQVTRDMGTDMYPWTAGPRRAGEKPVTALRYLSLPIA
jgi:hypothetical protein